MMGHMCHGDETRTQTEGNYVYTFAKCHICDEWWMAGRVNMLAASKLNFKEETDGNETETEKA